MINRRLPGLLAGLALLAPSSALAGMSCDDIMSLVQHNVPSSVIIDTIVSSGSRFSDEDVACLANRGAYPEVIAKAVELKVAAEPATPAEPVETTPESTFDAAQELGSDEDLLSDGPAIGSGYSEVEDAIDDYNAKRYRTASYKLYDLLSAGTYPEKDTVIKYYLARSLEALEQYHGAQHYYMEVVRKGPRNPAFRTALPKLAAIANHTGNDYELLRIVGKLQPESFPPAARPHLYYLMGRKAYEANELADAAAAFSQVPQSHPLYPRAQYFQGVIAFDRERLKSAAKAFREVIRAEVATDDAQLVSELEDLKDLSLINIARVYYGLQRFDDADKYYAKVERSSLYWPQSLFERAWTNFWTGDLNLALGLLLTTDSPYYDDEEFLPDTQYLRALTYFQLCDYDEAERIVKLFQMQYSPIRDEMKAFLSTYQTEEGRRLYDQAFDSYFGDSATADTTIPVAVFRKILRNRDLAALVRHLDMMSDETKAIDAQTPQWRDTVGRHLQQVIEADRLRYKERAGQYFLQEMLDTYKTVRDLLADTDVLLFEITDAVRLDYEYQISNVVVDDQDEKPIDFATDSSIIYWPFNGEFWNDELAYYRFTEAGECQSQ